MGSAVVNIILGVLFAVIAILKKQYVFLIISFGLILLGSATIRVMSLEEKQKKALQQKGEKKEPIERTKGKKRDKKGIVKNVQ